MPLLQVCATSYAQSITINRKSASLIEIFKDIRKQTDYDFIYSDKQLSTAKNVSIIVTNASVKQVLDKCFENQLLTYRINDKTITIEIKQLPFKDGIINRSTIDVSGTVIDEAGVPLVGAGVTIKGFGNGLVTNNKGEFFLKGVNENGILVITFIGYVTKEISVKPSMGEIKMERSNSALDEVQVVSTGYENITKERAVGSFVLLDSALLNRRISTNIISRLEDIVPGLVFNRNANPGSSSASSSAISIRGQSTLFGKADPLIVIDNFPYEGDLANINPNDVQSISVLKDASAASIWGSRAGNGVIVITTKMGKLNAKSKVLVNGNLTTGSKPNLFYRSQMSSADFIEIEKLLFGRGFYGATETSANNNALSPVVELLIAKRDGKIDPAVADAQIENYKNYDTRNDINDYSYRRSLNRQYAASVRGGGDNQHYYIGLGMDENDSYQIGGTSRRVSLNANNDYQFLKGKLSITSSISIINNKNKLPNNEYNISYNQITAGIYYPYARLVNDNGQFISVTRDFRNSFISSATNKGLLDWSFSPLQEMLLNNNTNRSNDYRVNGGIRYTLAKGLNANLFYNYTLSASIAENLYAKNSYFVRNLVNTYTQVNTNGTLGYAISNNGVLDQSRSQQKSENLRAQVNYNLSVGTYHQFNSFAGYEVREMNSIGQRNRIYGYNEAYGSYSATSYTNAYKLYYSKTGVTAAIPYVDGSNDLTDRYLSYYGNLSYAYKGKYLLNASIRKDESNLFGVASNQKGIPLYSIGGAWLLHHEGFYKLDMFPSLKLRLSYGYNGNVYKNISSLTTAQAATNYTANPNSGLPYATIINPPNPELRWERIKVINAGLDFETKNKTITGTVEVYSKNGIDLIGSAPVDPTTGITTFTNNYASILGRGIELTLNFKLTDALFKWDGSLLFSHLRERVVDYSVKAGGLQYPITPGLPLAGKPLYSIYSYGWGGLDPTNGDPIGYLDGNKSKDYTKIVTTIKPEELIFGGSARPVYFGSYINNFRYKNLMLSINLAYRLGYFFRRNTINFSGVLRGQGGHGDYAIRWQNPGDELITNVPSMPLIGTARETLYTNSEHLVDRADHIRLQDINLSYQISKPFGLPFNSINIVCYANNLGLVWAANKAKLDPDFQQYGPPPKTFSIGLNVNL
ncbi:MAG: SusC/RagA family TonB-linked outer membrane protein [Bacteroidota bacterium]